ncbi:hypothetical protein KM043_008934 [Ampulex compressa]|nr:hypothetical protein KM043_008934 [Ampulex compressa]
MTRERGKTRWRLVLKGGRGEGGKNGALTQWHLRSLMKLAREAACRNGHPEIHGNAEAWMTRRPDRPEERVETAKPLGASRLPGYVNDRGWSTAKEYRERESRW